MVLHEGPFQVLRWKRPQKSGTLLPDFDGWWLVGKLKSSAFQNTIKREMSTKWAKMPSVQIQGIDFYGPFLKN